MRTSHTQARRFWVVTLVLTSLFTGSGAMGAFPDEYKEALANGDTARLKALLAEGRGELLRGSRNETLLFSATSYHHAENRAALIRVLLDAGFSPRRVDIQGLTPLHWAAGSGCVECIPLLLEAGADVDARRDDGETPLHRANATVVDLLLAAGADPKAVAKRGRVPMHTSRVRHAALLKSGINVRDANGWTPLHFAALAGDQDWVEWLLAEGADPALQSTAPFHFNEDEPDGSWEEPKHLFETGTRAYDIAKWGHDRTKWSTGQYSTIKDILDELTPRRGWFSR